MKNKDQFILNKNGKGKSKKRKIELANSTPLSLRNNDDEIIIIDIHQKTMEEKHDH